MADGAARPQVVLVGEKAVGKSTFLVPWLCGGPAGGASVVTVGADLHRLPGFPGGATVWDVGGGPTFCAQALRQLARRRVVLVAAYASGTPSAAAALADLGAALAGGPLATVLAVLAVDLAEQVAPPGPQAVAADLAARLPAPAPAEGLHAPRGGGAASRAAFAWAVRRAAARTPRP